MAQVWRAKLGRADFNHKLSPRLARQRRNLTNEQLARPVQIYRSPFGDPYLNLSIEHHLLQYTHPDSKILFLFINAKPCVVIGRNQNPWLEANLSLLNAGLANHGPVRLVRRRSGGGAVFHDAGNANWSVICPPHQFDRAIHVDMVVRALRRLLPNLSVPDGRREEEATTVRVNERHDIVHNVAGKAFKVSGSAYKLTRLRSLHHGTCLLSSPNLGLVASLLRSPAEPYIKARGVESVRSKMRNVGLGQDEFAGAVVGEFESMYGTPCSGEEVDWEAVAKHEAVQKGVREMSAPEWIFDQTPQFTFATHPTEEDPRRRPPRPRDVPAAFRAHMTIRHGVITDASLSGNDGDIDPSGLIGLPLRTIRRWSGHLGKNRVADEEAQSVGRWLDFLLGPKRVDIQGATLEDAKLDAMPASQTRTINAH